VRGGRVKLLDFGLARATRDDTYLTPTGTILGTPAYMAPEQARNEEVDARCDLFSLGCVLYHLCTGAMPFSGTDAMSRLVALATEHPSPPRQRNPEVPPALDNLILRLLAKDRADRPSSARAVIKTLAAIERERAASASVATVEHPAVSRSVVPAPAAASGPRGPSRRRWLPAAVAAAVLLAVLGPLTYLFGPAVIRFTTDKGELVLETDDRDIEVTVLQGGAKVIDRKKDRQFILTAKGGEVEFYDPQTGVRLLTKEFTLERGGRTVVRAKEELADARKQQKEKPAASVDDPWAKQVAGLPPAQQVEAVAAKLKERNPGFDGQVSHKIEKSEVVELWLSGNVKDISPVRALTELRGLTCREAPLSDLSPLKGMPLTTLDCGQTQVSDLSPLKGMPLTWLDCDATQVSDLSPLKDMKLTFLRCQGTQVTDLSPLQGMPLKELMCDFKPERDAEILRSLKTLEKINGKPAQEFWKEVDAKKPDKKP
jgi:hypothetical protein